MEDMEKPTNIEFNDREILELAEARSIFITYCFTKDRVLVKKQCQYAAKWYGLDGYKRILNYCKRMDEGTLI